MRDRNNQEDFNQNRSQRRKKTTGVIALGLAGVLVLGSLFAYFSDRLGGNPANVTTGTLDIQPMTSEEGYGIWIWKDDDGDEEIQDGELIKYENDNIAGGMVLNPGDMIVVKGDVKNKGSKSAWLMSNLNIRFTPADVKINGHDELVNDFELNNAITFYKEDADNSNKVIEDIDKYISSLEFNAESINVINGTIEEETATTAPDQSEILIGSTEDSGNIIMGICVAGK